MGDASRRVFGTMEETQYRWTLLSGCPMDYTTLPIGFHPLEGPGRWQFWSIPPEHHVFSKPNMNGFLDMNLPWFGGKGAMTKPAKCQMVYANMPTGQTFVDVEQFCFSAILLSYLPIKSGSRGLSRRARGVRGHAGNWAYRGSRRYQQIHGQTMQGTGTPAELPMTHNPRVHVLSPMTRTGPRISSGPLRQTRVSRNMGLPISSQG